MESVHIVSVDVCIAYTETRVSARDSAETGDEDQKLRLTAGYSQESFADACKLHRTYMGSLERGERNLTLKTLLTVARTLGLTVAELLNGIV